MVRCRDVGAVDMMCYLMSPEHYKKAAANPPTLRPGGMPGGRPGSESQPQPGYTTEQYVELMDKNGVDKSLICTAKLWEYTEHRPTSNLYYEEEEVDEWVKSAPGKMYGLAGYNPLYIMESVEKVEKAVKEWGFKGVYAHSLGYGLRVDDRKYYPLYETCVALDVPVSMQVGHAAEVTPSEVGRPMALDMIAIDFPKITLIGSHTGWPWCDELIALAIKHRNVYMDISAWPPGFLQPSTLQWMNGGARGKTMWGSNGQIERAGQDFDKLDELLTKDETKIAVLRENAMRVYKL